MPHNNVRTRFAPSPTGIMHVGNLRTALYEYLLAKSLGGKFILRIEDTDQERQVEGATEVIYRTLEQCGLKHDEGPDVGGDYGPYVQSQRLGEYKPAAEHLIAAGHAYYCFCTEERLAELKADSSFAAYDRHCRNLDQAAIQEKLDAGVPYTVRQKMPLTGETHFSDTVYGDITVKNEELEDQILLKADGFPTYNFANVVDDSAMKISHVVRGSEYLSSTPKYNLLYDAFGFEKPVYVHLPLILGEDGQKLSKRHGSTSFHDLVEEGYLPEAIVNYIALLGWAPKDNQEIFTLKELEQAFSIAGVSKSPSTFDYKKLLWFNQEYFRRMSPEEFTELCRPYFDAVLPERPEGWDYALLARLLQARLEKLTDIKDQISFLAKYNFAFDVNLFAHKKMKTSVETALPMLQILLDGLEKLPEWSESAIHDYLIGVAEEQGVKNGQVMWPCRIAIAGQAVTPGGAVEILLLLGRSESLERIKHSIERG